jgi:RND family efflux transporter MFP subunit
VLAQPRHALAPAGQDLVRVGLVADVPDDAVERRVEDVVQRDREFDQALTEYRSAQVLAPDDGVISARTATVGAVTAPGQELFRMVRQNRLEWRAEVTATELERIRPNMPVDVMPANGARIKGTVRMVGPTVDPQSRNGIVYVDLAPGAPARSGTFARGEFSLGSSAALTVPQQSVVVRDGFSYVFRLNPDGRVTQQKVHTGRRVGDRGPRRGQQQPAHGTAGDDSASPGTDDWLHVATSS